MERYYDVNSGNIKIDDVNLKDYNLRSLREHIGFRYSNINFYLKIIIFYSYVGQEPVLFSTSIRGNLLYGNP